MSKTTPHFFRRIVLVGLCIAILMTAYTLILAPGVGAASDTIKTETKINDTNNIVSTEDALLVQRAIMIDEAKKEAQVAVSEQLAIQEAEAKKKAATEPAKAEETQASSAAQAADESYADYDYYESDTSSSTSDGDYSENTVSASSSYGFLMDIDNPDPSYTGCCVYLSDSDRDAVERMLMGEAGSMGYTGMALVAQCIRDTYVSGSYSSMNQLFVQNGYYGATYITPSSTAKEVVNYIFDQGGSAVQHSIRVFYASNYCTSAWHEAQEYVCSCGYVRFFDF